MFILRKDEVIGTVLVIIPLILNLVGMIVLFTMISCLRCRSDELSETNKAKAGYVYFLLSNTIFIPWPYLRTIVLLPQTRKVTVTQSLASTFDMITPFTGIV